MVILLEELAQDIPCAHHTIQELSASLCKCMDCNTPLSHAEGGQIFLGDYTPACYFHDRNEQGQLELRWIYQRK